MGGFHRVAQNNLKEITVLQLFQRRHHAVEIRDKAKSPVINKKVISSSYRRT